MQCNLLKTFVGFTANTRSRSFIRTDRRTWLYRLGFWCWSRI